MSFFPSRHLMRCLPVVVIGLSACSSLVQEPAPIVHKNRPGMETSPVVATPLPIPSQSAATVYQPPPSGQIQVLSAPPAAPLRTPSQPPVKPIVPTTPVAVAKPTLGDDEMPPETYVVKAGDNLFRIALNNGLGYRELAELNGIADPAEIKVGQVLRLRNNQELFNQARPVVDHAKPPAVAVSEPSAVPSSRTGQQSETQKTYPKAVKQPYSAQAAAQVGEKAEGKAMSPAKPTEVAKAEKPAEKTAVEKPSAAVSSSKVAEAKTDSKTEQKDSKSLEKEKNTSTTTKAEVAPGNLNAEWIWPVQGKLIASFNENNKGIDIAGKSGQPVYAANSGKVVYSGTGLRGYGKLIIIKHDKTFLSAYAHNRHLLVKEGDDVKKGQKIAEMGNTDADQVKLHFEIRRFGKPVDPITYLGKP